VVALQRQPCEQGVRVNCNEAGPLHGLLRAETAQLPSAERHADANANANANGNANANANTKADAKVNGNNLDNTQLNSYPETEIP